MKGKSKLIEKKRGRVTEVVTQGTKKKYRVTWDDSSTGVIFARSLEKIPVVGAPPPFIGPTLGENQNHLPHREDDLYEEQNEDSDSGIDSERERDLDVDNEIQPEDGLVPDHNFPVRRCVFAVQLLLVLL